MHNKTMTRATALVLGLVVSATMLAACGGTKTASENTASQTTASQSTATQTTASQTTAKGVCDGGKHYTIGFSHPVSEVTTIKALKKIVASYAAQKGGCIKVLLDSTTASNLQTQRSTIESWVTQGIGSVVIFPVDPTAFVNLQKQAQAKGMKWLSYAGHIKGEDGSVGFDSDQSGTLIANDVTAWIKKHYPNGDVSAVVTTLKPLPFLAGRWTKPQAALKALNVPIVSMKDCADQTCGLQIAQDALREHPNLRVFIGLNDDAALGAQKAFVNAGISAHDVYINGEDGGPEGLANLQNPGKGAFRVTAAIDIRQLGHDIVDNSIAAITGQGEAHNVAPTYLVKTGDNEKLAKLAEQYK
jgi:ABC-type sugar transport system substrate-binding protein